MSQSPQFQFDNTFANLSDKLFSRQKPTPVSEPAAIKINTKLAEQLGLNAAHLQSEEGLAILAGNALPSGADPLAMAYAGHQFGNWAPQLGDGRAILLGEVLDKHNTRYDIQLKGAGRTPYSRGGDGRAAIGPVVREYIVSEAMAALGVPTTRALSAVTTGDTVQRETMLPGAVLARVATSLIRVGTFQFFAARGDTESIKNLTDYVIARHYPHVRDMENPALELLKAVIDSQAALVAQWQSIGFIHGVMNTDNASVAGITIDYGPCAFMDAFNPAQVFSSIDYVSRYAYKNQPAIAQWNMANLAQCLLPLINGDEDKSIEQAQAAIDFYPELYTEKHLDCFRKKLGLMTKKEGDAELVESLMSAMAESEADFTNTFRALSHCSVVGDSHVADAALIKRFGTEHELISSWIDAWRTRHAKETAIPSERHALMQSSNPAYIPRNHRIEQVISAALNDDYAPMNELTAVLATPYKEQSGREEFASPPAENELVKATFCGT